MLTEVPSIRKFERMAELDSPTSSVGRRFLRRLPALLTLGSFLQRPAALLTRGSFLQRPAALLTRGSVLRRFPGVLAHARVLAHGSFLRRLRGEVARHSPLRAWTVLILAVAPTMAGISRADHPYELDRPMIGLPVSLPCADGVKDPIFSILVGLVDSDIYGTLTQDRLVMQLDRMAKTSKLPYRSVREVTRLPRGDGRPTTEVSVTFDGPLALPIPYSILGYNPGSFRATERCVFREWDLGTVTLQHSRKRGNEIEVVPIVLENVHLYGLEEGEVTLDIDGWVDRMFGGNLDDTDIVGLLLCRYEGKWIGVAMGYNEHQRGRSGALDFGADKVVFPSPDEIKTVGRTMRSRVEGLLAQARAR